MRSALLVAARTAVRQPHHFVHLLERKLRCLGRYHWVRQSGHRATDVPAPLVLKLLLTYRCNLRCRKCMLWGESGWCAHSPRDMREELDFDLLRRTLEDAARFRPSLIFSGGEPFLYSRIAELLALVRQRRWPSTFCTNGTGLDGLDAQLDHNPTVSLLISLDGPADINDELRGEGVYARVTASIRRLRRLARPPHLGVQLTLRRENVGALVRFCEGMVELGVDWVLLNPPWFVSERQAAEYAAVLARDFATEAHSQRGYLVPFDIDPAVFRRELEQIRARRWPIQIGCYFGRPDEISEFGSAPERPTGNDFCFKQWLRMDVLPSGQVTPCAQFPDVVLGDLRDQPLMAVWNGPAYARFRQRIRAGLLPVCSKCNALYLYDAGRTTL
jgi:radical SAM protein with 4Fe4S-binding SPASM domain